MIVVDSSALICVTTGEPQAERCQAALLDGDLLISGATLVEVRIVALRRGILSAVDVFLEDLGLEVISVDEDLANRAVSAYQRWGKGFDPAGLNFGDSFSYALAEMYGCPLLYIGDDFARTDIRSALD